MISKRRSLFTYIDNNSCGSNFSDHSDMDEMYFEYDKLDSECTIQSPRILKPECSEYSNDRLIGDLSRYHTLPILKKSKHQDLASIDSKTLVDLLKGKYDDKIGKYIIFDARYPYEFTGGHIVNAQSSYEKESIMETLFKQPVKCENGKRVVLIFHCEFSIERGPKLMREIREMDRMLNKNCYPSLYYPEIYLLEGGYKFFYENHVQMCEPKSYLPMLNDDNRNEMKFFRRKSKTWEIDAKSSKTRLSRTKLSF